MTNYAAHYQPLLPAPHYASLMEYQHGLKQIGHRLHTHLTRKASRDTGSRWDWADDYSPKQAEADKLALRADCWYLFEPGKVSVHAAPTHRLVAVTREGVTTITTDGASPVRLASRF